MAQRQLRISDLDQKRALQARLRRRVRLLPLWVAPFLMAITLPQCPGQAEMQARLEQQQTLLDGLQKRVTESEKQLKTLSDDMAQAKNIFTQIATAIQEQTTKIDALTKSIDELKTKPAVGAKRRR